MFCYYAECRILFTIVLNVIMPNDIMVIVIMLSVVEPSKHDLLKLFQLDPVISFY